MLCCHAYNTSLAVPEPIAINVWSMYPNPVDHEVWITLPSSIDMNNTIFIQIFDFTGEIVSSQKVVGEREPISLSTLKLPTGIYILRVYSESGLFGEKKLLIMR